MPRRFVAIPESCILGLFFTISLLTFLSELQEISLNFLKFPNNQE